MELIHNPDAEIATNALAVQSLEAEQRTEHTPRLQIQASDDFPDSRLQAVESVHQGHDPPGLFRGLFKRVELKPGVPGTDFLVDILDALVEVLLAGVLLWGLLLLWSLGGWPVLGLKFLRWGGCGFYIFHGTALSYRWTGAMDVRRARSDPHGGTHPGPEFRNV